MRGIGLLIALLRADAYGSGAFGPEVARASRLLAAVIRVTLWALGGAGLGSALGLVGLRWLAPGAEEARLPGILLGGLSGFLCGLGWGLWRERGRFPARNAA